MARPKFKKLNKLTAAEAAYLAGLIDGEGTVTLSHKSPKAHRQLAVSISSTEYTIVEWVKRKLGVGKITNKKSYSNKHSRSFAYVVYSRQALSMLEQIIPFMVGYKRSRAILAVRQYIKLTPRNGKYTPEQRIKKIKFADTFFKIVPNEKMVRVRNKQL